MVNRFENRQAILLQLQDSPTKRLVVMDQVEVVHAVLERIVNTPAERHGFAEGADAVAHRLGEVGQALDFPERRHTPRIGVIPDVQTWQLVQNDVVVDVGIWIAAEDLDMVTEISQRSSDVAGVHTLPAAVLFAPIRQERDAKWCVWRGTTFGGPWPW